MIHKYRAWINKLGVMIMPDEICYIAFTEGNGAIVHEFGEPVNAVYEDVILMQFTGLSDKNGVEIYEGDVVFIDNKILGNLIPPYNWLDDPNILVEIKPNMHRNSWEHFETAGTVIGNKMQHPHLLNE